MRNSWGLRWIPSALAVAAVLLPLGCGGRWGGRHRDGGATLQVSHELGDEMPTAVGRFQFRFLDGDRRELAPPLLRSKSGWHSLEDVPVATRFLQVVYLEGGGPAPGAQLGTLEIPVLPDAHAALPVAINGDPTGPVCFAGVAGRQTLKVRGKDFTIKGIGGDFGGSDPAEFGYSYLKDVLTNTPVNTIRIYGVGDPALTIRDARAALDLAHQLTCDEASPVMVIVGLDLRDAASPRTGYATQVVQTLQGDVHADHVLAWCVANEYTDMGNPGAASNQEIEAVAKAIHAIPGKPKLPIMTAVVHPTPGAVATLKQGIPDLDLLGVNSFYGAYNATWKGGGFLDHLANDMKTWDKPWCLTEYYSYDLPSEPFGTYAGMPRQKLNGNVHYYLELNATANAQNYANAWRDFIAGSADQGCIGGCALNWMPPHNSQVPAFWKQMFTYRGAWRNYVNWYLDQGVDRLPCVDAVLAAYGAAAPAHPCPQILAPADGDLQGIACAPVFKATLEAAGTAVDPDQELTATVAASGTGLSFDWYLIGGTQSGGIWAGPSLDPTQAWYSGTQATVTSILVGHGTTTDQGGGRFENTLTFRMRDPQDPTRKAMAGNNYQLRVIVRNGTGGASTACVGFRMKT